MGHPRQLGCIVGDFGYIEKAADVGPAVADEHADPRIFSGDIALGRKLGLAGERESRFGEGGRGRCSRPAGLDDGLGNVLWLAEGAYGIDSGFAGLERVELRGVAEAVLIQLDPEPRSQLLDRIGDLHAHREHHHVEALVLQLPRLVLKAHQEIVRGRILAQAAQAAAGVLDAVPVAGPLVVAPVALRERPHVHHEDMDFEIGLVLLRHDGFFGGVHAAHRRAVIVALVARPDALQEGDPFGGLVVGRPLDVSARRTGGR